MLFHSSLLCQGIMHTRFVMDGMWIFSLQLEFQAREHKIDGFLTSLETALADLKVSSIRITQEHACRLLE